MTCPACQKPTLVRVTDSRFVARANAVYRRRRCPCGYRATTYETLGPAQAATDAHAAEVERLEAMVRQLAKNCEMYAAKVMEVMA